MKGVLQQIWLDVFHGIGRVTAYAGVALQWSLVFVS